MAYPLLEYYVRFFLLSTGTVIRCFLASACDSIPWSRPVVKSIFLSLWLIYWLASQKNIIHRVLSAFCLTLICGIFSWTAVVTIFLSYDTLIDLLIPTTKYMLSDGPTDGILEDWTDRLTCTISHFGVSSILFYREQLSRHITSHWRDAVAVLAFIIPLRDEIQRCNRILLKWRLFLLHGLKLKIRGLGEGLHQERIGFKNVKSFEYDFLRPGYIRLLRLKRRSLIPGLIDASVFHAHFDDLPEYEALSYVWGSSELIPILLNGRKFFVTSNLHELLHARASIWRERLLWVDAICINQEDNQEKPSQIRLMREIYSKASRVIAWLGDPFDAYLAVAAIRSIHWECGSYIRSLILEPQNATNSERLTEFRPSHLYNILDRNRDCPGWQAFVKIIQSPYISRAWICQEAILAPTLQFYIAGYYVDVSSLTDLVSISFDALNASLGIAGDISPSHARRIENWTLIGGSRLLWRNSQYCQPLGFLLSSFSTLEATKPVDKIYALLGLANPDLAEKIEVNYMKPYTRIYTDVAATLLESNSTEETIHLLPHAGIGNAEVSSDLPSWVPDWHNESRKHRTVLTAHIPAALQDLKSTFSPLVEQLTNLMNGGYAAARNTVPSFTVCRCEDALFLHAVQVDAITNLTSAYDGNKDDQEYHPNWFREAGGLVVAAHSSSAAFENFWRTLVANRSRDTYPAPSEYGVFFKLWMRYHRGDDNIFADTVARAVRRSPASVVAEFDIRVKTSCTERRFAVTQEGRFALVPELARVGDVVCVIEGMPTPYVLRNGGKSINTSNDVASDGAPNNMCRHRAAVKAEVKGPFQLVGQCYVHGLMDGEGLDFGDMNVFKVV